MSDAPAPIPFPTHIDASMRAAFAACPRKFFYQYIAKRAPQGTSIHLTFGGAMARGLEVFRRAFYERGEAFQPALDEASIALIKFWTATDTPFEGAGAKTITSCVAALDGYLRHFSPFDDYVTPMPFGDQGRRAIEFTFAIPLDPSQGFPLHPQTGLPILYTGRFDMLAQTASGTNFILDDKTCSQMGLNFTTSMKLRSQFTGYKWACDQSGIDTSGIIVRATCIQKTQIAFAELQETRPDHLVAQWHRQLVADVSSMVEMWEARGSFHSFEMNLDDSCGSYGGCPFLDVCLSKKPEDVLRMMYVDTHWDPLAKESA